MFSGSVAGTGAVPRRFVRFFSHRTHIRPSHEKEHFTDHGLAPYETTFVLPCLLMTANSGFGMVGRDRFRLAFRTLNQAVLEQILG